MLKTNRREFVVDLGKLIGFPLAVGVATGAAVLGLTSLLDSSESKPVPEWIIDYQDGIVVDKDIKQEKLLGFVRDTLYFLQVKGAEATFWYQVSPTAYFDLNRGDEVEMGLEALALRFSDKNGKLLRREKVTPTQSDLYEKPRKYDNIRYTPKGVSVQNSNR